MTRRVGTPRSSRREYAQTSLLASGSPNTFRMQDEPSRAIRNRRLPCLSWISWTFSRREGSAPNFARVPHKSEPGLLKDAVMWKGSSVNQFSDEDKLGHLLPAEAVVKASFEISDFAKTELSEKRNSFVMVGGSVDMVPGYVPGPKVVFKGVHQRGAHTLPPPFPLHTDVQMCGIPAQVNIWRSRYKASTVCTNDGNKPGWKSVRAEQQSSSPETPGVRLLTLF